MARMKGADPIDAQIAKAKDAVVRVDSSYDSGCYYFRRFTLYNPGKMTVFRLICKSI